MPRNAYDDFMGFFGQDAEGVISGRTVDPVSGKVKATFVDTLMGRSQAELDSAKDKMDTTQRRNKGRTTFDESGYSTELAARGIDRDSTNTGAVNSAIRTIQEENAARLRSTLRTEEFSDPTRADEREVRDRRYYDDKAATAQARIDTLNAQMRSDRRADQRHNESMERLDRQDRRKAISGMTGGLAALAAAFAM